jgi:three-Cys-motif partner protein
VFQGSSKITHLKERHLEGIVTMRFRMLTHHMKHIDRLVVADVFCGSGENNIGGHVIDGSPLAILNGFQTACGFGVVDPKRSKESFRPHSEKVEIQISDIRPDAVASAPRILADKYSHKPDLFAHNSFDSLVKVFEADAAQRIDELHQRLVDRPNDRLFLFVDPNGPRTLPYPQIMGLLSDHRTADRVDVVVNISATDLKRMNGSRAANVHIRDWVGGFENLFATVLDVRNGEAWIRKPIPGDAHQWSIIVYWSQPFPHWDWPKAGFTQIGSADGQAALRHYSSTNATKKAGAR